MGLEHRKRALIWTVGVLLLVAVFVLAFVATGGLDGDDRDAWSWLTGRDSTPSNETPSGGTGLPSSTSQSTPGSSNQPNSPGSGRPGEPAADGSRLATITAPPTGTLAMVDAKRLPADARYTVTFQPYGYGPSGSGPMLVIRITTATSGAQSASGFDFVGRNVLARLSPGAEAVTVGGTYTAVLTFRAQGDLLFPTLSDVEPK